MSFLINVIFAENSRINGLEKRVEYLENRVEEDSLQKKEDQEMTTFEVESIELATPELFSNESEYSSFETQDEKEPKIFENTQNKNEEETKET